MDWDFFPVPEVLKVSDMVCGCDECAMKEGGLGGRRRTASTWGIIPLELRLTSSWRYEESGTSMDADNDTL